MSRYTVVLDACVLYPSILRDLLMRLSIEHLFKAHWTDRIHKEWINAYIRNNPDANRLKLQKVTALMNAHILDAKVEGYEDIESTLDLPDKNDLHVLAAAIKINADAIVTSNLKDFPQKQLDKYHIEVIHPDEFIKYQIDLSPTPVYRAVKKMRAGLKKPPLSALELVQALNKIQLPITAALLQEYLEDI